MISISDTTLCCIDCINYTAAVRALRQSMQHCNFERALFLTDRAVEIDNIDVELIPKLHSSQAYSQFVLKDLAKYIQTEYVLLVQWDGYVVNGSMWRDEYKNHDYIGAPWPWAPAGEQVGNGGFSLRSKRLLNALQDPRAKSQAQEDEDICRRFRSWLIDDYKISFAPTELAMSFSYERGETAGSTFGFHGLFNMHRHVARQDWPEFIDSLHENTFNSTESLELGLNLIQSGSGEPAEYLLKNVLKADHKRADVQYLLEVMGASTTNALNIEPILARGKEFQKQGLLNAALQLYSLAIRIDPTHPEPKSLLGVLCVEVGQTDVAIQYFQQALALKPEDTNYQFRLNQALALKK